MIISYHNIIQEALSQILEDYTGAIYEPVKYIMSIGGKRIRPSLILATAEAYGANKNEVVIPAIGMELFHNFTLVHDDIMDQADIRRNQVTVHKKWNENQALLSGDIMLGMAYEQIVKVADHHLRDMVNLFNKTTAEVCIGQQMDMDFESSSAVSLEEYLEMIKLKTSVLIGACMQIGALLAGANKQEQKLMYDYGLNIGMAFQIQDDYLDLYGNERVGKVVGGDVINNKKTVLYIMAKRKAAEPVNARLDEYYADTAIEAQEKISGVKTIFDQLEINKEMIALQEEYYQKALSALYESEMDSTYKEHFIDFAKQQLSREY